MASVTLRRLRDLTALYRQNIDGADHALQRLVEADAEAVAATLEVPAAWLADPDAVERVAVASETLSSRRRQRTAERSLGRARTLAKRLGHALIREPNGDVRVPLRPLYELVNTPGYSDLTFGWNLPVGLSRARLRAIFRECRTTDVRSVVLTEHELRIDYATVAGDGHYRLVLHAQHNDDDQQVCVAIPPERVAVQVEPEPRPEPELPVPMHQETPTTPVERPPLRRATPGTPPPFMSRLLDALGEAL